MFVSFAKPIYLWFLFSIPLLIISHFYFLRSSKSKALRFANFETLKRIAGERLLTTNMTHLALRVAIILFLVIAAAGTSFLYEGYSSNVNYVIAIDSSASMTAKDIVPSRFDAAKAYAKDFIRNDSIKMNVGLVSFAGVTTVRQPLTDDIEDFNAALSRMDISTTGGTDVPGAIITSTNLLLTDPDAGKSIILISDGINTLGAFVSDSVDEALKYAQTNEVKINTIGIGTDSGPIGFLPEYYNVSSTYDADLMKHIAEVTGGVYVYAETANDVALAYQMFLADAEQQILQFDVSFGALLVGLSLLFIEWGLANTLYRRIA